jgi:50S ribosomal protein L16 3-hydroxylase
MIDSMNTRLLGGLSPREFLRRHWQKKPLLVRGALPGFAGVVDERALTSLAMRDDTESRIVERRGRRWETSHGPFERIREKKDNWSILVNGVNHHVAAADELMRRFAFVPQARLDDVMVSFATPGGGVGPHVDSYDVFLLQGAGRRRWRVWDKDGDAVMLEQVVEPGDLLYVPPGLKHDGVALDRCFTYSIGFRTPRGTELAAAFLDWLHERGLPDATYRDPGLSPARQPGRIPAELQRFSTKFLRGIRWSARDVGEFLGEYLSAPKPHVVFQPARKAAGLARALVRLDPKTQLLYSGGRFFMNGESFPLPNDYSPLLRELADRRHIRGDKVASTPLAGLILEWHGAGYLHLDKAP